jgi:DNA polymerase
VRIQGLRRAEEGLRQVREELGDCKRCRLCEGRTQIVFGEGDPNARLMFVGEGPGAEEDKQGRPFVGKAGQLLDKMIGAMGLSRNAVFIANVVRCRPPENRDPQWDERLACRTFLLGQIEAIQPAAIVALGKVAAQTLLETEELISRMRGRWHDHPHFPAIRVMPTFHPAALLRDEALKRPVWEDLKAVMAWLQTRSPQ